MIENSGLQWTDVGQTPSPSTTGCRLRTGHQLASTRGAGLGRIRPRRPRSTIELDDLGHAQLEEEARGGGATFREILRLDPQYGDAGSCRLSPAPAEIMPASGGTGSSGQFQELGLGARPRCRLQGRWWTCMPAALETGRFNVAPRFRLLDRDKDVALVAAADQRGLLDLDLFVGGPHLREDIIAEQELSLSGL